MFQRTKTSAVAVLLVGFCLLAGELRAAGGAEQELLDYCMEGMVDEVQSLLEADVDPNAADEDGESALMYAASSGVPEIVTALIEAGADLNAQNSSGVTALMSAVISDGELDDDEFDSYLGIARVLLDAGADTHLKDEDGNTALDYARSYHRDRMSALLHEAE